MLTQSIQPKDPKPGQTIIVTFKNYKWAAEVTGADEKEILKSVQQANRENSIVTMRVPR